MVALKSRSHSNHLDVHDEDVDDDDDLENEDDDEDSSDLRQGKTTLFFLGFRGSSVNDVINCLFGINFTDQLSVCRTQFELK